MKQKCLTNFRTNNPIAKIQIATNRRLQQIANCKKNHNFQKIAVCTNIQHNSKSPQWATNQWPSIIPKKHKVITTKVLISSHPKNSSTLLPSTVNTGFVHPAPPYITSPLSLSSHFHVRHLSEHLELAFQFTTFTFPMYFYCLIVIPTFTF